MATAPKGVINLDGGIILEPNLCCMWLLWVKTVSTPGQAMVAPLALLPSWRRRLWRVILACCFSCVDVDGGKDGMELKGGCRTHVAASKDMTMSGGCLLGVSSCGSQRIMEAGVAWQWSARHGTTSEDGACGYNTW